MALDVIIAGKGKIIALFTVRYTQSCTWPNLFSVTCNLRAFLEPEQHAEGVRVCYFIHLGTNDEYDLIKAFSKTVSMVWWANQILLPYYYVIP